MDSSIIIYWSLITITALLKSPGSWSAEDLIFFLLRYWHFKPESTPVIPQLPINLAKKNLPPHTLVASIMTNPHQTTNDTPKPLSSLSVATPTHQSMGRVDVTVSQSNNYNTSSHSKLWFHHPYLLIPSERPD